MADEPSDQPSDQQPDQQSDQASDQAFAQQEWIPLDENPHADDKRDVLDPTGEGRLYKRLIVIGLAIGVVVAVVVLWLV